MSQMCPMLSQEKLTHAQPKENMFASFKLQNNKHVKSVCI